eukprot:109185_1
MSVSQRVIRRTFKRNGLAVDVGANQLLRDHLEAVPAQNIQNALSHIISLLKDAGLSSSVVTLKQLQPILEKGSPDNLEIKACPIPTLQVLNAFDSTWNMFDSGRKTFYSVPRDNLSLSDRKTLIFRQRYEVLYQQILRRGIFELDSSSSKSANSCKLTSIKSLLGNPGLKTIFGMLSEIEEGKCFIEDLSGNIEIDLSSAKRTSGMFTWSSFVLVTGELNEYGVFKVQELAFPIPDSRKKALSAFSNLDCCTEGKKDEVLECESKADDSFVILSDVHLDNPMVLRKLRELLTGLEEVRPMLFVFMGNFCSKPIGSSEDVQNYKDRFNDLAALISEFPSHSQNASFMFIPGPSDPGMCSSLPRSRIPVAFTARLSEKLTNVEFCTNPCRLRYYTRELLFFRENLTFKLRRNCILPPTPEPSDIREHLVKTIADQNNLCPLPIMIQPVHWYHSHFLQMYPLPSVLFLGDCGTQFLFDLDGTGSSCVHPGSFAHDFSFVLYRTEKEGESQLSRVP